MEFGDKQALAPLTCVCRRQRDLPPERRTRYRGALRSWPVKDPQTAQQHTFMGRLYLVLRGGAERAGGARAGAEQGRGAPGTSSAWLGRPHYKKPDDVLHRVGQILNPTVKALLQVEVGERNGKPTRFAVARTAPGRVGCVSAENGTRWRGQPQGYPAKALSPLPADAGLVGRSLDRLMSGCRQRADTNPQSARLVMAPPLAAVRVHEIGVTTRFSLAPTITSQSMVATSPSAMG